MSLAVPVTVTVSEAGYTGSYTVDASRCAGIATVASPASAGVYTITGVAAGTCAIVFTDAFAQPVTLPVIVTTTNAIITIG